MKKIKFFLLPLAFLLFSGCYRNQEIQPQKSITVNGTGTVSCIPDTAFLTFTVTTSGWSAKNITLDNDTISNRLIYSIKNIGVSEEDISKSQCVISNPGNSYESKRNISVTVRNLSLVPQIIDCKTASIKLKSVEYSVNDEQTLTRQARTKAIKNAQDAASLFAGASGTKTGSVINLLDMNYQKIFDDSGKINITATVSVTFEIQ